jgi:hypothetical protein
MDEIALFFHLLGAFSFVAGTIVAGVAFETARRRKTPAEIALLLSLSRIGEPPLSDELEILERVTNQRGREPPQAALMILEPGRIKPGTRSTDLRKNRDVKPTYSRSGSTTRTCFHDLGGGNTTRH